MKLKLIVFLGIILLPGCGQDIRSNRIENQNPEGAKTQGTGVPPLIENPEPPRNGTDQHEPPVENNKRVVLKGKIEVPIDLPQRISDRYSPFGYPLFETFDHIRGEHAVTVINPVQTNVSFDPSHWKSSPGCSPSVEFGSLQISKIMDNDLNLCGVFQNEHCNRAIVWTYTKEQVPASDLGVENREINFFVRLPSGRTISVARESPHPTFVQELHVESWKHAVRETDFGTSLNYEFFARPGKGLECQFRGVLVLEYLLME